MALLGNLPYGTTHPGGTAGYGEVFNFNADSSNFTPLYSRAGANDGASPYDTPLLSGNYLYGAA